jgi:putative peptidoglycan lipid II flippase
MSLAATPTMRVRNHDTNLRGAFARLFAGGMLGKLLGILRELALAASFGTGAAAGAYRGALTATLIPTHFFSSDTLNAGFIPLCSRYLREDPRRARELFWSVFALMNIIAFVIAAVLFAGADLWAAALVPGFSLEQRALTAGMIRAMAVGVPFYVQASLASYLEMAHGRYLIGSLRAAVQNVGLIVGIAAAALMHNPLLLGWGFAVYSILFALVGVWSIARSGMLSLPEEWNWAEARGVLGEFARITRPLLLLPLLHQGSMAAERIVASLISTDAVASLDYAKTVSETGLALIAVPLGMAGLAELGRVSHDTARAKLARIMPLLMLVTVPCSAFLAINAEPVVRLLYARGQFGEESVAVTTLVLTGLAIGFWAHVSGYVLAKGLSAQGRNGSVARIAAASSATHIIVNLVLFRTFGPVALGLAASAYGIVLLGLTAHGAGVSREILRVLAPLAVGTFVYLPIGFTLRGNDLGSLILSAFSCLVFWGVFVMLAPRLRAAARPLVRVPALGGVQ